jgi:hypothetical protein
VTGNIGQYQSSAETRGILLYCCDPSRTRHPWYHFRAQTFHSTISFRVAPGSHNYGSWLGHSCVFIDNEQHRAGEAPDNYCSTIALNDIGQYQSSAETRGILPYCCDPSRTRHPWYHFRAQTFHSIWPIFPVTYSCFLQDNGCHAIRHMLPQFVHSLSQFRMPCLPQNLPKTPLVIEVRIEFADYAEL